MADYAVFLQLIPVFVLLHIVVEIARHGFTQIENGLAAATVALLFLLFLCDFMLSVLPVSQAIPLTVYITYPCSLLAAGLSMLFHVYLARQLLSFSWAYLAILAASPLLGYAYLLLRYGEHGVAAGVNAEGWMNSAELSSSALLLLSSLLMCAAVNMFLCVWVPRSKAAGAVRRQFSLLFRANLLFLVSFVAIIALIEMLNGYDIEIPGLQIVPTVIWAYTMLILIRRKRLLPSVSRKFEILYKLSPTAIMLLDDELTIRECNPSALRMFGTGLTDGMVTLDSFIGIDEREMFIKRYRRSFPEAPWHNEDIQIVSGDGHERTLRVDSDIMIVNGERYLLAVFHDISDRKQAEERLLHQANHDALTGLPNRLHFQRELQELFRQRQPDQGEVAVMLIDLDRFKLINDSLGHQYGDEALIEIAERISSCIPGKQLFARLGGDEFVVVMSKPAGSEEIYQTARAMIAQFEKPVTLQNKDFFLAVSIGISIYPHGGTTADLLVRNADIAMYHAKQNGGNRYRCYTEELSESVSRELELGSSLRAALERNEFRLYYQPLIDSQGEWLVGAEVLLRWVNADGVMIPPSEFIPVAEDTGLIVPIGLFVLEEACREWVKWEERGIRGLTLCVNVSPVQLVHPDFVKSVDEIIRRTAINPEQICLEITEHTAVSNLALTLAVMKELNELGVSIAMDDFGTGYSSLSILEKLPVGKIKIDRSFLSSLSEQRLESSVIPAIIAMSHALGKTVVVEGVEQSWQAEFVSDKGADEVQGYYFSKPVDAEAFRAFAEKHTGITDNNQSA